MFISINYFQLESLTKKIMNAIVTNVSRKSALFSVLVLLFIFISVDFAYSSSRIESFRFNSEYKLKRIPNGTVTVYRIGESGKKVEYVFKNFNADVILSVYRKLNLKQITAVLARKYYLSETESRRDVKRTINVLENWGIVSRKIM